MVSILFVVIALVAVGVAISVVLRHRAWSWPVFVRRLASGIVWIYAVIFAIFIAGEAFTDPGGWQAAALTAAWLVPMVVLALLAWFRPSWADVALTVGTALLVLIQLSALGMPQVWIDLENNLGPVRGVFGVVLMLPLALLGRSRPVRAGTLLLVVGLVPMLVLAVMVGGHLAPLLGGSAAFVSVPAVVAGGLLLLGHWLDVHAHAGPTDVQASVA